MDRDAAVFTGGRGGEETDGVLTDRTLDTLPVGDGHQSVRNVVAGCPGACVQLLEDFPGQRPQLRVALQRDTKKRYS